MNPSQQPLPRKFSPGHIYRVLKEYESWFDSFKPGEELVFLNSAFSIYDSAVGFFFHDITSGAHRRIDTRDDEEQDTLRALEPVLEDLGPFMEPGNFIPGDGVEKSDFEPLHAHRDYFRAIAEGTRDAESWFKWLEANADLLDTHLTRADLLRFRYDGFSAIKALLDKWGETFCESPRYACLSSLYGRGG